MSNTVSEAFKKKNVTCVILCGGSGTRLWPLSRRATPKQFLCLGGSQESLLQLSLKRVSGVCEPSRRWIVTARGQEKLTAAQSEGLGGKIIVEPEARNTAAAVCLSAWHLKQQDPDAIMIVLSSDHMIQNQGSFEKTLLEAVEVAEKGYFVTVGIEPSYPATGFGYIEKGSPIEGSRSGFSVRSFREKPHQAAAEQFLRSGRYLWNAGIFIWRVSDFWKEFSLVNKDFMRHFEGAQSQADLDSMYKLLPQVPIDIAFIEQTDKVACVPASFDWDDVGSWPAVRDCFARDTTGNSFAGDVVAIDTKNCVVQASDVLVATIGIEDLVVVATKDAILVCRADRAQDVKAVVKQLEERRRTDLL